MRDTDSVVRRIVRDSLAMSAVTTAINAVRSVLLGIPRLEQQQRPENCTQTVLAMLLHLPVQSLEREAGTTGRMSIAQMLMLLSRFGVFCRPIATELAADFWETFHEQHGGRRLRGIGIQLPRDGAEIGHAQLLIGNRIFDPASGRLVRITPERLRRFDWLALLPPDRPRLATRSSTPRSAASLGTHAS